jgi:hypothetical protein
VAIGIASLVKLATCSTMVRPIADARGSQSSPSCLEFTAAAVRDITQ